MVNSISESRLTEPRPATVAHTPAPGAGPKALVTRGREFTATQDERWVAALRACRNDNGRTDPASFMAALSLIKRARIRFGSPEAMQRDLTDLVNAGLGDHQPLALTAVQGEGSKGDSGSPVMLVKRLDGCTVAVAKLFTKGIDEFVAELSALDRLAEVRPGLAVRPMLVACAEMPDGRLAGCLVMSRAPGDPFDDLMLDVREARAGASARLERAVRRLGAALADLHEAARADRCPEFSLRCDTSALQRQLETCKAHADVLRDQFAFDLPRIIACMDRLTEAYLQNPGPIGLIHGQASPGNFFWHEAEGVTLIDASMLHWFMGATARGFGLCARDIGRFSEKFIGMGRSIGLTAADCDAHIHALLDDYASRAALPPPAAIAFFRVRAALGAVGTLLNRHFLDLTDRAVRASLEHHLTTIENCGERGRS